MDTTATAQRCVELLRRQSLGVATFLILEKQQHLVKKMKEQATPPEGKLMAVMAHPACNEWASAIPFDAIKITGLFQRHGTRNVA